MDLRDDQTIHTVGLSLKLPTPEVEPVAPVRTTPKKVIKLPPGMKMPPIRSITNANRATTTVQTRSAKLAILDTAGTNMPSHGNFIKYFSIELV